MCRTVLRTQKGTNNFDNHPYACIFLHIYIYIYIPFNMDSQKRDPNFDNYPYRCTHKLGKFCFVGCLQALLGCELRNRGSMPVEAKPEGSLSLFLKGSRIDHCMRNDVCTYIYIHIYKYMHEIDIHVYVYDICQIKCMQIYNNMCMYICSINV